MPYFTAIEEVLDALKNIISTHPTLTELKHVGLADDEIFFEYPAVAITGEGVITDLHATHQFKNFFRSAIYVYHAQMNENRTTRTRNDLVLCSKIKAALATNRTLSGGVIFGFIDSQVPGQIARPNNVVAIGTRMTWRGEALEAFQ
jgi:hypothetical protein